MSTSQPHKSSDEERLEKVIHRTLQSLPDRTAPASLEARVMNRLAREGAMPWWRQSFAYWPRFTRILFLVISTMIAALVLGASTWVLLQDNHDGFMTGTFAMLSQFRESLSILQEIAAQWMPAWTKTGLQITVAVIAVVYLVVLGLGTAIYNVARPAHPVGSSRA